MRWKNELNIKQILNEIDEDDDEDIKRAFKEIGTLIQNSQYFKDFAFTDLFFNLPEPGEVFKMEDVCNLLLDKLYDYADNHKIWLG